MASDSLSPEERSLRGKIAADTSWANTDDVEQRTAPGLAAIMRKFEDQVDPDRRLEPDERTRRAKHAQRAHLTRIRYEALRAKREAAESETAEAVAADE